MPAADRQPLAGRTALVTGASRGLGRATALHLAALGADLVCVARTAEACGPVAEEIRALGCRVLPVACDVGESEQVGELFRQVADFGPLHLLFNNAGFTRPRPITEMADADWDEVLRTNARGTFLCMREGARAMLAAGVRDGAIVNNGSVAGLNAFPGRTNYGGAKAAVHMMTKVAALEWAAQGIRVNCVVPGFIWTENYPGFLAAGVLDLPRLERRVPLGRVGQAQDIAAAVAWLAGPPSRYVTGALLVVDGGFTAYGFL